MADTELVVGIDLGTTFSLIAYADESGAHIVRDENGDGRLPSVIGILAGDDGGRELKTGWAAREQAVANPLGTVYSVKRLIGKGMADIQKELPYLAYNVQAGPRSTAQVEIGGRRFTAEEISALILTELKNRAERHLARPVRKAIITVPAYFDDAQRQATRDAGAAAGLDVVRIVNEPTAAALAYGIGARGNSEITEAENRSSAHVVSSAQRRRSVALPMPHCNTGEITEPADARDSASRPETVAVYDLGGGTFDISILRIEAGVFQVLSTAGDTHLGGDDFDRLIIDLVRREVREQFGISIESPATKQALRGFAEALKIRLGEQGDALFELDLGDGRIYRRRITRSEFETSADELVGRTLTLVHHALRDAGISATQLDHFILVGGSTRMPLIRRRVEENIGRHPYTALNPDEVIALGAAIQGSILAGRRSDLLLLDVTPLSLGIETMGGAVGKLILRNTTIPCRAKEMFTTFVDGQTAIKLNVLQGERELVKDCRSLGEFELRGIPPMPAGIPKVEVEFLIDANGILNVSAREQRSGQQASIQIVPNYGLTRAEVERMVRDSIEHGRADLESHRRIDLLNQIAFDTQKTEDMLRKFGHLLDSPEKARLQREIVSLRQLGERATNLDEVHRALDAFGKSTMQLAEIGIQESLKDGVKVTTQ